MSQPGSYWASLTFSTLIKQYIVLQDKLVQAVRKVATRPSIATPGRFLLLQFQMSQVTQVGQSISNIISQVMSVINNTIRNQKSA